MKTINFSNYGKDLNLFTPYLEANDLKDTAGLNGEEDKEEGLAGQVGPDTEDNDVFKVIPDKVEDENTNFNIFAGRNESGNLNAVNSTSSTNDPALLGLSNVLGGSILDNKTNFEKLITILFDILGLKTLNSDAMKQLSPTVWKELENYADKSNMDAFTEFSNFIKSNVLNSNKHLEIDSLNKNV